MNANQIHIGHEYAIAPYGKPNGNPFIPNAIRFVAYRTFGEQEYGNKRLTMFVEGFKLDRDTGQPVSTTYSKYRVRDVIDDWEEYEDRADQHEVEQARIEKERLERMQREREAYEQRRRENEERTRIERENREKQRQQLRSRLNFVLEGLVERGINRDAIRINDLSGEATITLTELERWLKSLTKVECMTCHRDLIMLELPT
jgi:hypothetical protein